MKRLAVFLLVLGFAFSMMPLSAFAIKSDDAKFDQFLAEIKWEKQDYLNYLESKDWSLSEFDTIDELGTPLTEENVQALTGKLDLSRTDMNELLYEYGDLEYGQDVLDGIYLIFIEDLEYYIEFYLEDFIGTPIDDTNLQQLLEDYGFASEKELEAFLQEYDDSISYHESIEDLESSIIFYQDPGDFEIDMDGLFTELGLTEEEIENLVAHMETLDYEDPAFEQKLMELSDRMMAVGEFETADELTAEQIAEIMDIYSDMTDVLELKTTYYFVKDGEKTAVSLATLMTLESTEGADLLIEIYNLKDVFLADILLTAEMFGSDLIADTGTDLKTVEKVISAPPVVQKPVTTAPTTPSTTQTVKGGKLPATASDFVANAVFGLALLLTGIALFRRIRAEEV
ncbi:LPXTG-motif cell wall anchor domain-containing protein [Planococcus antarcticus DSM 14505]|uniref:LPXTG-motif cell wall anchor domain-containing protein n=1 Tax=Planococcus antarcticus DSM 14505 TaxID=1185653 RepID=A0AA87IJ07_9BACL|nr:processed acidic surface protein [Planococcus antarcticus]EIM05299.1 LPXTG-motif cell wall anchor domain-containing protein [Planococcus antarcticus DSM 14505]